jgi:hypothetical protein
VGQADEQGQGDEYGGTPGGDGHEGGALVLERDAGKGRDDDGDA